METELLTHRSFNAEGVKLDKWNISKEKLSKMERAEI